MSRSGAAPREVVEAAAPARGRESAGRGEGPSALTSALRAAPARRGVQTRLTVVPAPRTWAEADTDPVGLVPELEPEQPALPLLWPVPALHRRDEPAPATPGGEPTGRAPLPGSGGGEGVPPDLDAWVARLAAGALEVLHGSRPAGQLMRWFEPRVHRALADRAARVRPVPGGAPRVAVRSVHVSVRAATRDVPVVAEAAAVVAVGPRCRAVALRLSPYHGRWRVTALEVG